MSNGLLRVPVCSVLNLGFGFVLYSSVFYLFSSVSCFVLFISMFRLCARSRSLFKLCHAHVHARALTTSFYFFFFFFLTSASFLPSRTRLSTCLILTVCLLIRENFSRDDFSPHFSNGSMAKLPSARATGCSPVPVCVKVAAVCGTNFLSAARGSKCRKGRARTVPCDQLNEQ